MKDQYLWDRSGEVDPEIERIEQVLRPFRPVRPLQAPTSRNWFARERVFPALAASVLVVIALRLLVPVHPIRRETTWQILAESGPSLPDAARPEKPGARVNARLYSNQTLRTGEASRITIEAPEVGRVDMEPATELRIAEAVPSGHTLSLARGTIHALIWAPPRRFAVDTPSSRALDLGCEYTLTVEPSGDGIVKVEFGWVAFQFHGRDAFIPAGAVCRTSRGQGPATPYYSDAGAEFRAAVEDFDREAARPCVAGSANCGDRGSLRQILRYATRKDGLTLWHLLDRASVKDRPAIFDRFVQLVGVPESVTRGGVIAGDRAMLDRCWNTLDLMDVRFWRGWQQTWERSGAGAR